MSDERKAPPPPPSRSAPPQARSRTEERSREQARVEPQRAAPRLQRREAAATQTDSKSELQAQPRVDTAGRAGEKNIAIEWVDVWIDGFKPARFIVTTAAGHGLDVTLEQESYRKTYSGTTTLTTDITPIAPHGTKGKLTVRDTTTGETAQQPWTWHNFRGVPFWTQVVNAVKKAFGGGT